MAAALVAAMVLTVSGAGSASVGAPAPDPRHLSGLLSGHAFTLVPFAPVTVPATGGSPLSAEERAELTDRIDDLVAHSGADVGLAVQDLRTGAAYSYGAHEPIYTASVVKLSLVTMLLARAQEGGGELTAGERAQAETMIRYSDNDVTDVLYQRNGFTDGFVEGARTLGLSGTEPNASGVWGATRTTAADQIRLLRALYTEDSPLSEEDRAFVLGLMETVAPEQGWGVSAAAGPEDTVGVKNGWTPRASNDGLWNVNSVGFVAGPEREYLVAVLTDGNSDYAAGVELIESMVSLVTETLEGTQTEEFTR
ncbi:beta-lactamase class A [Nocardiopsis sp. Huas11]|uniref:serine hydrolase n=1 Tax=Nocardiopsis sp. Huas11 TaxID=2183912 RepID=UPI000F14555D|nr:serine hydrolase [Nocardiopsis sp. Huas11]RKS10354.1 beta-lactamase class A [Nocardiopsis sp. Huas11]